MADAVTDKKVELRVIAPTMATDKSPYKFKQHVDMVIMRCSTGDLGILPGRAPVSMVLGTGVLRIFDGDSERHMAVIGGVAHSSDDVITILSDSVKKPDEIDAEKVAAELKDFRRKYDETKDLKEKQAYRNDFIRCQVLIDVAESEKK